MQVLSAEDLAGVFTFPALIEALRNAFRADIEVPVRHHHKIARPGEPDATLLLMPAWTKEGAEGAFAGVKVVSVYPGNAARGLPSVVGSYLLMDGATGAPLAVIDGQALTLWRTAAASALAATFLARKNASRLVMVGAGALAPYLVAAHASVRPIAEVLIWNRSPQRAEKLAAELNERAITSPSRGGRSPQEAKRTADFGRGDSIALAATADLEAAVRAADIVSCATLAAEPLVKGAWLKPGAHLDLVGAFTPKMREADDEAVRRARVFVDTRQGALKEAGDIVQPLEAGVIGESDIAGDLFDLCRGKVEGRTSPDEITLFKSVGTALEDLAAALLAHLAVAARR